MRDPTDPELDAMRRAMDILEEEFDGTAEIAVVVVCPVGTPDDERCTLLHANNLIADNTSHVLLHALHHLKDDEAPPKKSDLPS
jgi:hypothetical protein